MTRPVDGDQFDIVLFQGPWSVEEKALVERTVRYIQEVRPLRHDPTRGCLWVCVLERVAHRALYAAHCQSDRTILQADDARSLAREMTRRAGLNEPQLPNQSTRPHPR